MSEKLGLVSVLPGPGPGGPDVPRCPRAASERTRELVDEEVRRITDESYEHAVEILRAHRERLDRLAAALRLDRLAAALLEHETLDESDAYRAAGLPPPPGAPSAIGSPSKQRSPNVPDAR